MSTTISRTRALRRAITPVLAVAACLLAAPAPVHAQLVSSYTLANASSLGAIPPLSGGLCSSKSVTFDATGVDVVQRVEVGFTASYQFMAYHAATLISPSGRTFPIFTVLGGLIYNPLDGRFLFSDRGIGSWLSYLPPNGATPMPGNHYRTLNGTTITSLDAAFAGDRGTGRWTLLFENCASNAPGQISAASLYIGGSTGAAGPADGTTLGTIPDGPSAASQTPGAARDVKFYVPPGRGVVTGVSVRMTLSHTWMGDLEVRLIGPGGQSHVLFGYTGATSAIAKGSRADLGGTYHFHDQASQAWWATVLAAGSGVVPGGAYRTSQPGGAGATGATTAMTPVFAGLPSAGLWTLRITDGAAGDIGTISAAALTLETAPEPVATADTYVTPYATTLTVGAPGVLSNDSDSGGGSMVPVLVSGPSHGTLALQSNGSFTYTPFTAFAGADSFRYRPLTTLGYGAPVTVTITVPSPTALQAPVGLTAEDISGQQVTLRWKAAPGPAATDFVLEGGVVPGQPIATIGVGGPLPVLTFTAPRGVFFVRVRSLSNGVASGPSNEIRIVVDVPEVPSAPAQLTGVVSGDVLGLSWRNTFNGGAAADLELLVSGAATAALALPLGESISLGGVPPGTYSFQLRARNRTGAGAASNPVTLTFPGGCSGPPAVPQNLLVFTVGNVVHAYWDLPAAGPAATSYLLNVTGSVTATVPMPTRSLHAPVPPGSYGLSVAAQNACGVSAFTAAQTAFVR